MGAAFGAVVVSFTSDILMQLIAAIGARPDFGALAFEINGTPIRYGNFLTAVLSFLIVAFAIFLVVKAANRLQRNSRTEEAAKESLERAGTACIDEARCIFAAVLPIRAGASRPERLTSGRAPPGRGGRCARSARRNRFRRR